VVADRSRRRYAERRRLLFGGLTADERTEGCAVCPSTCLSIRRCSHSIWRATAAAAAGASDDDAPLRRERWAAAAAARAHSVKL